MGRRARPEEPRSRRRRQGCRRGGSNSSRRRSRKRGQARVMRSHGRQRTCRTRPTGKTSRKPTKVISTSQVRRDETRRGLLLVLGRTGCRSSEALTYAHAHVRHHPSCFLCMKVTKTFVRRRTCCAPST